MRIILYLSVFLFATMAKGQKQDKEFTREYLTPVRIVWQNEKVINSAALLQAMPSQPTFNNKLIATFKYRDTVMPSIILDYGKEIHGGLLITTQWGKACRVRIRFGESVSEAMSELGKANNATNEHSIRDQIHQLTPWGTIETGNTGFRFVKIDLIDSGQIDIKCIKAISVYRDLPYLGSFKSNDEELNTIWKTGAYTVQLNMQEYLWDGIKRDRLVWIGDAYPEVKTILSVFGSHAVIQKSLDLIRDETPLPQWMQGIPSYSMWWVLIQQELWMYSSDKKYLIEQKKYLIDLLNILCTYIDEDNSEKLPAWRFLDWPSSENKPAIHAGLHALLIQTLEAGALLCVELEEPNTVEKCKNAVLRLRKFKPADAGSKQAAALLSLAGLDDAKKINKNILSKDPSKNISTFYGYFILQARAKAGDYQGAMTCIKEYWGKMIELGATTFWEDFNLAWTENAIGIQEIVPKGKNDIHGDHGDYCYKGLRMSLCHGWAAGPTPWLSENVLGIKIMEPGCKTVKIEPHLGNLEWAEGSFPTPYGLITVKHVKQKDGQIISDIHVPKEIKIIR